MNRFAAFNPEEREILQVLLESHANAVAQIAIANEVRAGEYLAKIEWLEAECNGLSRATGRPSYKPSLNVRRRRTR